MVTFIAVIFVAFVVMMLFVPSALPKSHSARVEDQRNAALANPLTKMIETATGGVVTSISGNDPEAIAVVKYHDLDSGVKCFAAVKASNPKELTPLGCGR